MAADAGKAITDNIVLSITDPDHVKNQVNSLIDAAAAGA